jgi:tetratricopeptide (TPR) repeat protein
VLAGLAAVAGVALVWPGIKGTRVVAAMLPVHFRVAQQPDDEEQLDRLTRAIAIWPQAGLHHARAIIHHDRAIAGGHIHDAEALRLAHSDYQAAAEFNPKFPAHHVNAANVLSLLGDDAAAEALYQQAVRLQGEMERAFLAHFHESDHFRRKGVRLHQAGDIPGCLRAMEMAAASIEAGTAKVAWQSPEARQLRAAIHESLAAAREAAGDREGALEAYDLLAEIPGALRAHYLAGMLLMRWADAEWHARRPEDALPRFIEARRRLMMGRRYLPPGVTEEDFREALESVDRTIKFLRDAGFEPPAR